MCALRVGSSEYFDYIPDSGSASSRRCIEAAGRWEASTQAMCVWEGRSKKVSERSLRPGGRWKLALSKSPISRTRNAGQSASVSPCSLVSTHEEVVCRHGGRIYRANLRGPGGEHRLWKALFSRTRNAGQSAAAPRSGQVFKHQTHTILDGEDVKNGNLRGASVSSPV